MLDHLNRVKDVKIYSVFDDEFKSYGRVHEDFDLSGLIGYMESETAVPESGNV